MLGPAEKMEVRTPAAITKTTSCAIGEMGSATSPRAMDAKTPLRRTATTMTKSASKKSVASTSTFRRMSLSPSEGRVKSAAAPPIQQTSSGVAPFSGGRVIHAKIIAPSEIAAGTRIRRSTRTCR
jgi:hypothetical protein